MKIQKSDIETSIDTYICVKIQKIRHRVEKTVRTHEQYSGAGAIAYNRCFRCTTTFNIQ